MTGISEFVRGTLAYLSNCAVALLTLISAALRLQPVKGALRCKVRHEVFENEVPDSRVMLFLASCLLGILCTSGFFSLVSAASAVGQAVVGGGPFSRSTIVISVAIYFTCEWAISRATLRAAVPGRRGLRNRHVMRFFVATLLIQVAIFEPVAISLAVKLSNLVAFGRESSEPNGMLVAIDGAVRIAGIVVLLAPLVYLGFALDHARALNLASRRTRALAVLPLSLIFAIVFAAWLTWAIFPRTTPQIASLRCVGQPGTTSERIVVDVTFTNPGDQWWRPTDPLRLHLEPSRKFNGGWMIEPEDMEGDDPLVVPPRGAVSVHRVYAVDKGAIQASSSCSLANGAPHRSADFFSIFFGAADDINRRMDWTEVRPNNFVEAQLQRHRPPSFSPGSEDPLENSTHTAPAATGNSSQPQP